MDSGALWNREQQNLERSKTSSALVPYYGAIPQFQGYTFEYWGIGRKSVSMNRKKVEKTTRLQTC